MIKRYSFFAAILVCFWAYLGTDHLLFSLKPDFSQYILKTWTTRDGLPQNAISCIVLGPGGYIWVKAGVKILRFDGMEFLFLEPDNQTAARLDCAPLKTTNRRLEKLRTLAALNSHREFFNTTITALFEDNDGTIWLGSASRGLGCFYPSPFTFYTPQHGLSHPHITTVYQDLTGDIWLGTRGGGLNRFRDETGAFTAFTTAHGLSVNHITALAGDWDGRLWIGTANGLHTVKDGIIDPLHRFPGVFIRALLVEGGTNNTIWIGTNGSGLLSLNTADGTITAADPDRLNAHMSITALTIDSDGILWVGSSIGLWRFRDGKFHRFSQEEGLSGEHISIIRRMPDDSIWVATLEGGVQRFRDGTFTPVRLQRPLIGPVGAILVDERKNTWISTANGLICLESMGAGRSDPLYFGTGLLHTTVFSSGSQPAAWKTRDRRLWFPTPEGVTVIPAVGPGGGAFRREQPVYIESIAADGNILEPDKPFYVPAGTGTIGIHFSAPNFRGPESLTFKCRLQKNSYDLIGNLWPDGETETVTRDRFVAYKNLPAGRYTLSIIARGSNGNWNKDNDKIPIVEFFVNRLFTETIWFYLLLLAVGLAAAGMLLLVFRKRTRREPRELIASHEDKYKTFKLTNKESKAYLKELVEFMEKEQPYLDPRCSLIGLAQELETSKEVLSQVVNRELHLNFNAFVNSYRVEEAKRKLRDPKENQYVILKIAHDVGFNSKSSFNAVFKRMTGLSPSQYREKHQKLDN